MNNKIQKPHLCPVCGKFEFPFRNSYAFCEVCGWQDDSFQAEYPDEDGFANTMSLNQARKAYAEGRPVN